MHSIISLFKNVRILGMVFLMLTLIHSVVGIIWKFELKNLFGHQFSFEKLVFKYDHHIITDFLNSSGKSLNIFNISSLVVITVILLCYAIIQMGLIWLSEQESKITYSQFIATCKRFWIKGLLNTLVIFVITGVWIFLVFILATYKLQFRLNTYPSEKPIIWGIIACIVLLIFGLAFMVNVSLVSKKLIIFHNYSVFKAIGKGIKLSILKARHYIIPWLLFVVLNLSLLAFYLYIEKYSETVMLNSGNWLIYCFILFQQVILLILFIVKIQLFRSIRI